MIKSPRQTLDPVFFAVQYLSLHQAQAEEMHEKFFPPLLCAVTEWHVGHQLVIAVHTSHVQNIILHCLRLGFGACSGGDCHNACRVMASGDDVLDNTQTCLYSVVRAAFGQFALSNCMLLKYIPVI